MFFVRLYLFDQKGYILLGYSENNWSFNTVIIVADEIAKTTHFFQRQSANLGDGFWGEMTGGFTDDLKASFKSELAHFVSEERG